MAKKKTQLKPIPRPFATTSVSKKAIPVSKEPETSQAAQIEQLTEDSHDGSPGRTVSGEGETPDLAPSNDFDPEKAEEQSASESR